MIHIMDKDNFIIILIFMKKVNMQMERRLGFIYCIKIIYCKNLLIIEYIFVYIVIIIIFS